MQQPHELYTNLNTLARKTDMPATIAHTALDLMYQRHGCIDKAYQRAEELLKD